MFCCNTKSLGNNFFIIQVSRVKNKFFAFSNSSYLSLFIAPSIHPLFIPPILFLASFWTVNILYLIRLKERRLNLCSEAKRGGGIHWHPKFYKHPCLIFVPWLVGLNLVFAKLFYQWPIYKRGNFVLDIYINWGSAHPQTKPQGTFNLLFEKNT